MISWVCFDGVLLISQLTRHDVWFGVRVVSNQELSDQEGGGRDTGDDARRPSIPPQIFPDNQQVFVGNLPQFLSDKELHEFFGRTYLTRVIHFHLSLIMTKWYGAGLAR